MRRKRKNYVPPQSLADFLQERGRRSEGNEILSPVVEWFVEGFETGDLKQAKALLDQLA